MPLPIVFNENFAQLLQLNMVGSVGLGGRNDKSDVVLVQALLNATPSVGGGPANKLDVDGMVGPVTIGAIRHYQQKNTRIVDGRIDVGGPTIMSLVRYLNSRGLVPYGLPNLGLPRPEIVSALTGRSSGVVQSRLDREGPFAAAGRVGNVVQAQSAATVGGARPLGPNETGWEIVTSSGLDVSVRYLGVAVINMYMKHNTEPGIIYRFSFAGSGVGLSMLPVGIDYSHPDMESYGSKVIKGYVGAKNPPFNANEFDLLPTTIITAGANAVVGGWNGTLISFGGLPAVCRYFAAMHGMQVGLPGPAINLYVGAIAGWT